MARGPGLSPGHWAIYIYIRRLGLSPGLCEDSSRQDSRGVLFSLHAHQM